MNKKSTVFRLKVLCIILGLFSLSAAVHAKKEKKEKKAKSEKPVRGEVVEVNDKILIFKTGKGNVEVKISADPKYSFIGFKGYMENVTKPKSGFFVSVSRIDDSDTINGATFSPPFPALKEIENKHTMTAEELFKIADANKDGHVTYIEYATHIYQSLKHGPGKFRKKMDKDSNGLIDPNEFKHSLNEFTWYRLSRKSAEQWFKERDLDKNQELDLKEGRGLFRVHGDLEPTFKKCDKDKSGGISLKEYKAHWTSVVTGPQRQ